MSAEDLTDRSDATSDATARIGLRSVRYTSCDRSRGKVVAMFRAVVIAALLSGCTVHALITDEPSRNGGCLKKRTAAADVVGGVAGMVIAADMATQEEQMEPIATAGLVFAIPVTAFGALALALTTFQCNP